MNGRKDDDIKHFLNIIRENDGSQDLFEAQNYPQMFTGLLNYFKSTELPQDGDVGAQWEKDRTKNAQVAIHNEISWAKRVLKRNDRIVWWLRIFKLKLLQKYFDDTDPFFMKELNSYNAKTDIGDMQTTLNFQLIAMRETVQHAISIDYAPLQNYVFGRQHYNKLIDDLRDLEAEWKNKMEGDKQWIHQDHPDATPGEILMQFKDGSAWWLLEDFYCSEESRAMGHCGNSPGSDGQRILSYRTPSKDGQSWRPSLTFILDENDVLGEMKGRGNNKPDPKYHQVIFSLLIHKGPDGEPVIKGINGGGYLPQNNFALADLGDVTEARVKELNPYLKTLGDMWKDYGDTKMTHNAVEQKLVMLDDANGSHFFAKVEYIPYGNGWRLERYDSAKELIAYFGDSSAKFAVKAFEEGDLQLNISDWVTIEDYIMDEFFSGMPEKIEARLERNLKRDHPDDFEDGEMSVQEILYVNDKREIMDAAHDAIYTGYAAMTEANMYDALMTAVRETEVSGYGGYVVFDSNKEGLDAPVEIFMSTEDLISTISDENYVENNSYEDTWVENDAIQLGDVDDLITDVDWEMAYERFDDDLHGINVD